MLDCRCICVFLCLCSVAYQHSLCRSSAYSLPLHCKCVSFYFLQTCFICPVKQTKPVTCTCDWVWEKEYSHWCGVITCVSWKEIRTRSSCSCTQCVILHCTPGCQLTQCVCVCVCVSKRTELHSSYFFFKPPLPPFSICFWKQTFFSWSEERRGTKPVFCSLCLIAVNVLCNLISLHSWSSHYTPCITWRLSAWCHEWFDANTCCFHTRNKFISNS